MTPHIEHGQLRLAERERSLADARAALRAEREQLTADRAESDRLLAEARDAHQAAVRERNRARKLAPRFVSWVKQRHANARQALLDQERHLAGERDKVAAEFARLISLRSEFHTTAAATRDRLRDAWSAVETQQERAAADWAEAEKFFAEQTATLESRAAELVKREKSLADERARFEAETVGLREEAAALETRVGHARTALSELETERDRVRAELLSATLPLEMPSVAVSDTTPVDTVHNLERERAAVAALKESLEQETNVLADRKRVLAEQFTLLADARAKWQSAERQTVVEMEEMARDMERREADLDGRERRLIRADVRRRDDAYDLWQLRLKLESWQTKLTAFELRWHTEREQAESELEQRSTVVAQRESEAERLFKQWEKARAGERERLRAELDHWQADRERMAKAAAEMDLARQLHDAELSTCAARAMAAEELVASAVQDSGSDRMSRRLAVLRKKWERLFDRKVKEIDDRSSEVAGELASLADRYRRLHELMASVTEREAAANNAAAAADLQRTVVIGPIAVNANRPARAEATVIPELAALRQEVERVAVFMLDMELPEPPATAEDNLPFGAEVESENTLSVFQFDSGARAA